MNQEPTIRLSISERVQLFSKWFTDAWYSFKVVLVWAFCAHMVCLAILVFYLYGPTWMDYMRYLRAYTTIRYLPPFPWKWEYVAAHFSACFVFTAMSYLVSIPFLMEWSISRSEKMTRPRPLDNNKVLTTGEFRKELRSRKDRCRIWLDRSGAGIPMHMETGHIGVVGATGGGKSQSINRILPYLFAANVRCIFHDCKEDYYATWGKEKDVIFCPLDIRHCGWTILKEVENLYDTETIVVSFIPDKPNSTSDDYWIIGPRQVFTGILRLCIQTGKTKNSDIWYFLNLPIEQLVEELIKVPGTEAAIGHIGHAGKKDNKAPHDIMSILKGYCQCLEYMADTDGDFNITRWLLEGEGNLFLLNYAPIRQAMRPVLTAFVNLMIAKMLNLSPDLHRRISFILDELPQLNKLGSIVDLLTLSRDRGAMNIIGYQNIGAIRAKYGPDDTENILANIKTNIICQLGDMRTAKEFSEKMGEHEEVVTLRSHVIKPSNDFDGSNFSEQIRKRPLVRPEELINLEKTSKTYQILMHMLGYRPVSLICSIIKYKRKNDALQLRAGLSIKDIMQKAAYTDLQREKIEQRYVNEIRTGPGGEHADDMEVYD